ncbi:hypothetical protein Vretimale_10663, partial [Volvox reticuliferus]
QRSVHLVTIILIEVQFISAHSTSIQSCISRRRHSEKVDRSSKGGMFHKLRASCNQCRQISKCQAGVISPLLACATRSCPGQSSTMVRMQQQQQQQWMQLAATPPGRGRRLVAAATEEPSQGASSTPSTQTPPPQVPDVAPPPGPVGSGVSGGPPPSPTPPEELQFKVDNEGNVQLPKEVIDKLKSSVFGFDTFWVTSVDNYGHDGVVFKGNVRGRDPAVSYQKMRDRLQVQIPLVSGCVNPKPQNPKTLCADMHVCICICPVYVCCVCVFSIVISFPLPFNP